MSQLFRQELRESSIKSMSHRNTGITVSNDLKHEYQEGTLQEIQINCANEKKVMVCISGLIGI